MLVKSSSTCSQILGISVSCITEFDILSVHKVLSNKECGSSYGFPREDLFQINHYIGSWEYFERPNDQRMKIQNRTREYLHKQEEVFQRMTSSKGDDLRNWLQGFVTSFGKDAALVLLEGIGFP